jgi:hypothetical protein
MHVTVLPMQSIHIPSTVGQLQVLKTQYAVRGELYLRAEQLRREGKEIIFTNGKSRSQLEGLQGGGRVVQAGGPGVRS